MPGFEAESAGRLDSYLAAQKKAAEEHARAAGAALTGA
jgi:hypothetical protein